MTTTAPTVDSSDRVLFLAPHPDDESVAAGGLLQRAHGAGARVLVCYLTDGERNPWAQRASEHRLRITARARTAFGAHRRNEASAAMEKLGLSSADSRFLGFPDQGLTRLLIQKDIAVRDALAEVITDWRPTLLLAPSCADLHPDHSALAILTAGALARLGPTLRPQHHLAYVVHNPALRRETGFPILLPLTDTEVTHKAEAITCHRSQLPLRGGWLRAFATQREAYLPPGWPSGVAHPIVRAIPAPGGLELELASRVHWRAFGPRRLLLLVNQGQERRFAAVLRIPGAGGVGALEDPCSGETIGLAMLSGSPSHGRLTLTAPGLVRGGALCVKIEHRYGFFDEAGWRELDLPETGSSLP